MNPEQFPVQHYPLEQITSALLWLMCRSIANPSCPCARNAIRQHLNMLANHPQVDPQLRHTCLQLQAQMFERQREQKSATPGPQGVEALTPATRH